MSTPFPITRGAFRIIIHLLMLVGKLPWWLTAIMALIIYFIIKQ